MQQILYVALILLGALVSFSIMFYKVIYKGRGKPWETQKIEDWPEWAGILLFFTIVLGGISGGVFLSKGLAAELAGLWNYLGVGGVSILAFSILMGYLEKKKSKAGHQYGKNMYNFFQIFVGWLGTLVGGTVVGTFLAQGSSSTVGAAIFGVIGALVTLVIFFIAMAIGKEWPTTVRETII